MDQGDESVLPCICADHAPGEMLCGEESFKLAELHASAGKRVDKIVRAFNRRPTPANALRARDAYAAALQTSETLLRRTRACLELAGQVEETEQAIASCSAKVDEIDQMLAAFESEVISEQQPRELRQQRHRPVAEAQSAYRTTRRVMRWFNLR